MGQFEGTIWGKYNTMEKSCQNYDFSLNDEEIQKKKTDNAIKSNKCNQCKYASSWASNLNKHLKVNNGEKPNKCNQCDYASSQAGNLRTHLKSQTNEKTLHPSLDKCMEDV